jgi:hypothetical protein
MATARTDIRAIRPNPGRNQNASCNGKKPAPWYVSVSTAFQKRIGLFSSYVTLRNSTPKKRLN